MINLEDAVDIIQNKDKLQYPSSCKDFGAFWLFMMQPAYMKENEICLTGTVFPIVYKSDGKLDYYDITEDPEAYLNAEKVF